MMDLSRIFGEVREKFSIRLLTRCLLVAVILVLTAGFGFDCGGQIPPMQNSFDRSFYDGGGNNNAQVQKTITHPQTGVIFVGGEFSSMNNVESQNIVVYNPNSDTWSPLAKGGLDGEVSALMISGNYLYVGGNFMQTKDGSVTGFNKIARYSIGNGSFEEIQAGTWSPLPGGGVNREVYSLAVFGNEMYVGGEYNFEVSSGAPTNLNSIARYNLNTNTWSSLTGNGLNGPVNDLLISGNTLFVAGTFSETYDSSIMNINCLARYDMVANTWSPLAHNGLNGTVNVVVMVGDELYVGGFFGTTADSMIPNLNNIARYNLTTNIWFSLTGNGLNSSVNSLAVSGSNIFVGGTFTQTANGIVTNLNKIAIYNTSSSWSALTGNGLDQYVTTMTISGEAVYIGGGFTQIFNAPSGNLNGFARYLLPGSFSALNNKDLIGNEWSSPGFQSGKALNFSASALAADANGFIYAGGAFTRTADGSVTNLNRIARYNPATKTWSALANDGLNGLVSALAIDGDNLYVGGSFTRSGDSSIILNRVARYNLTTGTWSPLSNNGLNGTVYSLSISGGNLYVGGDFSRTANNVVLNLNRVARYNTSADVWSSLRNNGLNGLVVSTAISGDELYVGGFFSQTFGGATTNLNRIARYNITTNTWSALAQNGLNDAASRLMVSGDSLYMRGNFTQTFTGATTLDRLARYNTSTNSWSAISGSQIDYDGATMTSASVRVGDELYVAGDFTELDGAPAAYFTRIYLQQWAIPALNSDWFDNANWKTGTAPTANANAVIPSGAGQINITSADVSLNDFNFNGGILTVGAGRTLTINGILSLNGGTINGDGTLVIANCQPDGIMGGSPSAYIQTALMRCVNGSGTFNFPVGTISGYSPITVRGITGTGNISVKANEGAYTNPAGGLPANRLARWWQIENPGGGVTNSNLYLNYRETDIAGTESNYGAYRISGGTAQMVNSSVNTFSNVATAENVSSFSDWTLAEFAPTAAEVSLGGRVLTSNRQGISRTLVTLTKQNGETRSVLTNSFGNYRFHELPVGEIYVISVYHRKYQFNPASYVVTLKDNATDINFVGETNPN